MLDHQGMSKCSGFVSFSTPDEATKALNEMNGKMIGQKHLYIMEGFHPGAPRLTHPVYFVQGGPGMIPHQLAGYGFPQQLMPGMRPGVEPNFVVAFPFQRQGKPGQRMGMRRGGNLQHIHHQQINHRNSNQGFRRCVSNGRNNVDSSIVTQAMMSHMMHVPFDVSSMSTPPSDIQRFRQFTSTLASALASSNLETQRLMLGEQLFPLVERLERESAGKLTGMLLEMDQTEVLHLIESLDALNKTVGEATDALRLAKCDVGDQITALSLNE